MKNVLSLFVPILFSTLAFAQVRPAKTEMKGHDASSVEMRAIPARTAEMDAPTSAPSWSPIYDTADFKYVLMSTESYNDESDNLRYTIAKNLPDGVKLVLLVNSQDVAAMKKLYAPYISMDRVIFATSTNISNGFWARDAFPYPVVDATGKLSLVEPNYYRNFTAGPDVAKSLNLKNQRFNFTFVGGNLLADEDGTCFTVDSRRLYTMNPSKDLTNTYGCKSYHLMPHTVGIGDVDEVLKPLGNHVMLTNQESYVSSLKSWGYTVVMLPEIANTYRTYANSLIVGKTVFMPSYGVATDAQAQKVYEDLGYTVIKIKSNSLSDDYQGSIHCQTMAYPAIPEQQLLEELSLKRVN
ncbi:hypothetical protein CIK05_06200 [Bdellovibrio sp. qaytius]|nr:hypothetical protein CIK05_06200 [Bdellovibrio sp. qaytius]